MRPDKDVQHSYSDTLRVSRSLPYCTIIAENMARQNQHPEPLILAKKSTIVTYPEKRSLSDNRTCTQRTEIKEKGHLSSHHGCKPELEPSSLHVVCVARM